MDRYRGQAELVDLDGEVFDTVSVYLIRNEDDTWGGQVEKTTFDGGPWDHISSIRLEGGSEGQIKMTTRVKLLSDRSGHVRDAVIEGVGEAPF